MVKLSSNTKYMIPWYDTTGKKNYLTVKMNGGLEGIDRRLVWRNLRKLVNYNFPNSRKSNEWVKLNTIIVPPVILEELESITEEFIRRISEDNDSPDSNGEGGSNQSTEGQMQSVSNYFREHSE